MTKTKALRPRQEPRQEQQVLLLTGAQVLLAKPLEEPDLQLLTDPDLLKQRKKRNASTPAHGIARFKEPKQRRFGEYRLNSCFAHAYFMTLDILIFVLPYVRLTLGLSAGAIFGILVSLPEQETDLRIINTNLLGLNALFATQDLRFHSLSIW